MKDRLKIRDNLNRMIIVCSTMNSDGKLKEVLNKYRSLVKDFETTCKEFDPIREDLKNRMPELKNDLLLNWHPDFEAVSKIEDKAEDDHLQNCVQSVKLESIPMPKIKSSVEFIKEVSTRIIDIIESLNEKQHLQDKARLPEIKMEYVQILHNSSNIEEDILTLIKPLEATSECSNYNKAIVDLQYCSRNMSVLISQIDSTQHSNRFWKKLRSRDHDDTRDDDIAYMWDRLKQVYENMKSKIESVTKRFKGIIAHSGTCLLCLLKSVKNSIKRGVKEIVHIFTRIVDSFLDLMQSVAEKMFNFMAQLVTIAEKSGFQISQFNMTMPSIKFEFVNLFLISLPVPQIESPEISISIQSK